MNAKSLIAAMALMAISVSSASASTDEDGFFGKIVSYIPSVEELTQKVNIGNQEEWLKQQSTPNPEIYDGDRLNAGEVIWAINADNANDAQKIWAEMAEKLKGFNWAGSWNSWDNGRKIINSWDASFNPAENEFYYVSRRGDKLEPHQKFRFTIAEFGGKYFVYIKNSTYKRNTILGSAAMLLLSGGTADVFEGSNGGHALDKLTRVVKGYDGDSGRPGQIVDIRSETTENKAYRKAWTEGVLELTKGNR